MINEISSILHNGMPLTWIRTNDELCKGMISEFFQKDPENIIKIDIIFGEKSHVEQLNKKALTDLSDFMKKNSDIFSNKNNSIENDHLNKSEKDDKFELGKFNPTKVTLLKLVTEYKTLTINGVDDKDGFNELSTARKDLKSKRNAIEKRGDEIRKPFRDICVANMVEQKELIAIIEPIEKDLFEKENAIKEEKEKIKKDKTEAQERKLGDRLAKLQKLNVLIPDIIVLKEMSDEDFETFHTASQGIFDENEKLRKKQEEQDKIDKEALEEKQKEIDKKNAEMQEKQEENQRNIDKQNAKIKADQDKIKEDKRKIDEENAKILADKAQKIEKEQEEERMKKVAENAKKQAEKEAEEKKKAEAEEKKLEQEKLDKKVKYQDFLKKNGVTNEMLQSEEVVIIKNEENGEVYIYTRKATFKYK